MFDIYKIIGNKKLMLVEALQQINDNSYGIIFIVDDEKKLLGSVSDGDIRRFLLAGGNLDSKIVDVMNINPKFAHSKEDAIRLYHKKNCSKVPIVNEKGIVIDVYAGEESDAFPRNPLNIPVVINAGGKGTRLDPFTRVLPKPLIPVGDMPILEHIMREYQTYNCNKFHIIVNYKKELIKAYFSDGSKEYDISWYIEEKPLGTGGGLSLLKGKINSTFIFANCDVLLTSNYGDIVKFHNDNHNIITMICAYKNISVPYGVINIGDGNIIESMVEKPVESFLINTGIYIVEPEVIDSIDDNMKIDFPDIIENERKKGKKVAAYTISEDEWMDMGQHSELEKMRIKLYGK